MSLWRHGHPRFANIKTYAGENARRERSDQLCAQRNRRLHLGRDRAFRDKWKKPLVSRASCIRPMLSVRSRSASTASGLNHGGRQIEALPAPIDVLPAIAAQAGSRATVLFDSGVRSGLDVVRAVALGAQAAFAGKAFLWGLGALGADGPRHVIDLMVDETRAALGQIGAKSPDAARSVVIRHPGALTFPTA
jgi:L-lactate dehydrogenase (cytochrome)